MARGSGRSIPWLLFCIGYLAAWFVSTTVPTRLLWHLPLEHRFTFEVHPLQLGADFYGRLLLCLGAGALLAIACARPLQRRAEARPWLQRGLTVWALGLLVLTAGLYIALLAGRQPVPAPLPPGYVPR